MFSKNKQQSPKEQGKTENSSNLLSPSFGQGNAPVQTAGKVGKSHHEYFKVMNNHKSQNKIRPITFDQLSKHKSVQSAWLSLNGTVYDVTVYINYHPGGKILLDGCGKQCIQLFNAHHPWVNATYLLEKYKIGFLSR